MLQISNDDIEQLILLGSSDTTAANNFYAYFEHRDFVNRQDNITWLNFTQNLSNEALVALFKGLVKAERHLNWIGGSVAGAIWVYKVINERNIDINSSIADYGLRNSSNPWVPFGSSYYGKRTIQDYFIYQKEKTEISTIRADRYGKILSRVAGRKYKRAAAIVELRKLSSEERRNARASLLQAYADKSLKDKIEVIAHDEKYPPEYYPIEWIDVTKQEIEGLPLELIKKLYDKLSTKTKGKWRRFRNTLKELEDGN